MSENQEKSAILIRYPQIRGYILEAHELQQLIATRFDVTIELEEHTEYQLALILDGKQIYAETANEQAQINHMEYIEVIRRHHITKRENPVSSFESEQDIDEDPDHCQWINNVCSGE